MIKNSKYYNSNEAEVYTEQVRLLYKTFTVSVVATFVAAILFVASQWAITDHKLLLGWMCTLFILTLLRSLRTCFHNSDNADVKVSVIRIFSSWT